jgi:hypothetical protein
MHANPLHDIAGAIPEGVTQFGHRCLHPDFADTPKNAKRRERLLNAHKERMDRRTGVETPEGGTNG